MRGGLLGAIAAIAVAAVVAGCGSSGGNAESTVTRAERRVALDSKLVRLEERLKRRRAAIRAQSARREREVRRKQASDAATSGSRPDPVAAGDFAQVEAAFDGEVGARIGAPGSSGSLSVGNLGSGSAWSTSKVPISLRVLEDAGGPSGLSAAQADEMRRALTLSDNEAAAALFADLEHRHGGLAGASTAVGEILREAGDSSTEISTQGRDGFSTYGQTEWPLASQQLFMSKLAAKCIGSPESDQYVLNLMGEVSSDTWGLGSAGLPARWKGGWGPGTDGRYLARQMGILYVGDKQAVVTLAAIPADGTFETAEAMATTIAQWLTKQAPRYAAVPSGC